MHTIFYTKTGLYAPLLIGFLYITACSRTSVIPEPGKEVDVSHIPDAIPKNEPKSRYGNPKSYVVFDKRYYVMKSSKGFVERGLASWYGAKFHGKRTSSGETYDMYAMTAAHKNLPLPTYVKITNLENGRHVIVRVNDRGPFYENRIIDLSYTAAVKLAIIKKGTGLVEVRALEAGQPIPDTDISIVKVGAPVSIGRDHGSGFYIQVGSFRKRTNAEKLRRRLVPLAKHLVKISRAIVEGNHTYRVRIGPLGDIDSVDGIVSRLADYGIFEHLDIH